MGFSLGGSIKSTFNAAAKPWETVEQISEGNWKEPMRAVPGGTIVEDGLNKTGLMGTVDRVATAPWEVHNAQDLVRVVPGAKSAEKGIEQTGAAIGEAGRDVAKWGSELRDGMGNLFGGGAEPVGDAYNPDKTPFQRTPEQQAYLKYLEEKAYSGIPQGASAAEQMLQQQSQKTASQLAGVMGSARGGNQGAMGRAIGRQAADQLQTATGQAGIIRAQEAAQMRGEQRANEQLLGSALANQNLSLQDYERLKGNISVGQQQLESQAAENAKNRQAQIIGGLGAGAMAMAAPAASDVRLKQDIQPANGQAKDYLDMQYRKMLNELDPYTYDYKNKSDGKGKQLGVMAQDLEKTPLGNSMVNERENGMKEIKPNVSTILAGQASLNERLNKLEQGGNMQGDYLDYMNQGGRSPASMENPGVDYIYSTNQQRPGKINMLDELDIRGKDYVTRPSTDIPRINQPTSMPVKKAVMPESSPVKKVIMPSPTEIKRPMTSEAAPISEPEMQRSQAVASSPYETQAERMDYLDRLRKNYDMIHNAFTKNYNQLG